MLKDCPSSQGDGTQWNESESRERKGPQSQLSDQQLYVFGQFLHMQNVDSDSPWARESKSCRWSFAGNISHGTGQLEEGKLRVRQPAWETGSGGQSEGQTRGALFSHPIQREHCNLVTDLFVLRVGWSQRKWVGGRGEEGTASKGPWRPGYT